MLAIAHLLSTLTSCYAKSLAFEWFSTSGGAKRKVRAGSSRKFRKQSGKKRNVCRTTYFLQHRGANYWQSARGVYRPPNYQAVNGIPRGDGFWAVRHSSRVPGTIRSTG